MHIPESNFKKIEIHVVLDCLSYVLSDFWIL